MNQSPTIEPSQVLDSLGELIAALSVFASKVPAKSFMAIPGGIRPTLEAVETYENMVYRFRDKAGLTYKGLNGLFIESLEAFEAGRVFDAVPPLLQSIEHLVELHKEEKISFTSAEQERIREFRRRLDKILPDANKPEIDLPPPTSY